MTNTLTPPSVTSADRLGLMLFLAVVLHGIIILGISFAPREASNSSSEELMEITLAQTPAARKPDEADYLAQTHQEGSGNTSEKVRPSSPPPAFPSTESLGTSEVNRLPARKQQKTGADDRPVLTVERAKDHRAPDKILQPPAEAETPSAAELIMRSKEIAKLSTLVDESYQAYTRRPRQRYVTASTQEFRFAAYLEAWRMKVERIGNLNYPEEAKRSNISGSLTLDVAINPDGTIHSVDLRRSSGYKVLDDAAVRIVQLAAPYAPLPPDIRKDTDILHITRTWQFLNDHRLETAQ